MRRILCSGLLLALVLALTGCGPEPTHILPTGIGGRLPRPGRDPAKGPVIPNATNKQGK
jgi:hypothetical protein